MELKYYYNEPDIIENINFAKKNDFSHTLQIHNYNTVLKGKE